MTATGTILLVEDDVVATLAVERAIRDTSFDLVTTSRGEQGVEMARGTGIDVVLLDWGLPDIDGLEVVRRIRSSAGRVPIVMVTERDDEHCVVAGLGAGADDYVVKPIRPQELLARIYAVMRRSDDEASAGSLVELGDLAIDRARHEVRAAGKAIDLTRTQFRILWCLASRPGQVFTRDRLLDYALGVDAVSGPRTIDVHIRELRKRLGSTHRRLLRTVRGVGYRFEDDSAV